VSDFYLIGLCTDIVALHTKGTRLGNEGDYDSPVALATAAEVSANIARVSDIPASTFEGWRAKATVLDIVNFHHDGLVASIIADILRVPEQVPMTL